MSRRVFLLFGSYTENSYNVVLLVSRPQKVLEGNVDFIVDVFRVNILAQKLASGLDVCGKEGLP